MPPPNPDFVPIFTPLPTPLTSPLPTTPSPPPAANRIRTRRAAPQALTESNKENLTPRQYAEFSQQRATYPVLASRPPREETPEFRRIAELMGGLSVIGRGGHGGRRQGEVVWRRGERARLQQQHIGRQAHGRSGRARGIGDRRVAYGAPGLDALRREESMERREEEERVEREEAMRRRESAQEDARARVRTVSLR